ncbi:MAG: hypothetical protein ACKVE4_08985 [Dissulfuribacterales bacterium]
MTIDRLIHLFVGVIFLFGFIKLSHLKLDNRALFLGFISMAIGTWMPDWDLILGIGFHRSPLTHSLLPALLVGWIVFKRKLPIVLIIGFSLGLSSHLFWDIVAYGNVQWIKGGNNDRLFLLANSAALIVATIIIKLKKY